MTILIKQALFGLNYSGALPKSTDFDLQPTPTHLTSSSTNPLQDHPSSSPPFIPFTFTTRESPSSNSNPWNPSRRTLTFPSSIPPRNQRSATTHPIISDTSDSDSQSSSPPRPPPRRRLDEEDDEINFAALQEHVFSRGPLRDARHETLGEGARRIPILSRTLLSSDSNGNLPRWGLDREETELQKWEERDLELEVQRQKREGYTLEQFFQHLNPEDSFVKKLVESLIKVSCCCWNLWA